MKVENMTSSRGNKVANQFIINHVPNNISYALYRATGEKGIFNAEGTMFQSYESNICWKFRDFVVLDSYYWNYSKTTSKYRSLFLGESTKETQKKIDSGEYILTNLN